MVNGCSSGCGWQLVVLQCVHGNWLFFSVCMVTGCSSVCGWQLVVLQCVGGNWLFFIVCKVIGCSSVNMVTPCFSVYAW